MSEGSKCWDAWQFYDSNQKPFGRRGGYGEYGSSGEQHGKRTITAPTNACYIRLSFRSFGNGHMMFEAGTGSASFKPSFDDSLKLSNRNLVQRTDKPFVMGYGITNTTWDDDKKWAYLDLTDPDVNPAKHSEISPQGQFYNFNPIKDMTYTQSILIDTDATFNPNGRVQNSWFTSQGHNLKQGCFEQLSETTYRFWSTYTWQLEDIALRAFDWWGLHSVLDFRNSGTYLAFYKPKLESGELVTDYSLAPEDLGWSATPLVPTQTQRYLWKFEYVYYSDGSVEVSEPVNLSIAGADADTTGVTDAINQTNQTVSSLQNSVSQAQSDLATVSSNLTQARQNLENSIASVNTKAQAVESTLAQVQSTANTNSQKTATLESNLDGLSAKFSSLKVGGTNLYIEQNSQPGFIMENNNALGPQSETRKETTSGFIETAPNEQLVLQVWETVPEGDEYSWRAWQYYDVDKNRIGSRNVKVGLKQAGFQHLTDLITVPTDETIKYIRVSARLYNDGKLKLERGNIATDYSPNEADLELKVADYKQTADQNYASLQNTVQALDGTVTANKATADQTAQGLSTRIESLETYQDGETTRANQYFEAAKTETARQLTAERTAIANDYVAKSTYTSDVTGIRNDLTATTTTANTTKTNLANYQASNDQVVASLQSSLQTTDGNVSSLQTQIDAVPGQISSAVSAVEGKIPKTAGGRNLALGTSAEYNVGKTSFSGQNNETIVLYKIYNKGLKVGDKLKLRLVLKYSDIVPVEGQTARLLPQTEGNVTHLEPGGLDAGAAVYPTEETDEVVLSGTSVITENHLKNEYWNWCLRIDYVASGHIQWKEAKAETGDLPTPWSPAPEDYDAALTQAKSEIKQTTDAITASVSSVQTAASNAQSTANTAVSKADAAQAGVNTLDSTTVKSASLNLDNNGFVTKVGKTIDGNKFATMIAQDANNVKIIADEMQVTANMIVDGAVTANKLNVDNLSAVNSNLGAIKGGSLLLQESKSGGSVVDNWGTYTQPAYKQGLFLDNTAFASSGAIRRKNGNETTPTDMPLAVLQSGELRFLVVDYNDNLENVVHYGLSDPDFGAIRFEIDSELKRRLTMTSSGYLNFQASNYTDWTSTGVSGCEYMIQGRLVVVNYDVTFNSAGTHTIGGIPQEFTKKSLMMTAKAWSVMPDHDRNIQLNSDGGLHILNAEANVNYRGTLVFSY